MFYRIIPDENCKGKIYVPQKFYAGQFSGKTHTTTIRAGLRKLKVSVEHGIKLNENEVKISADVLDILSIPLNISYQIRLEEDEMCIGPVIGLLLAQNSTFFTQKRLDKFLEYALRYEEIQGLIYVFSGDEINLDNNTAKGFYYIPGTTVSDPKWKKGVFPLPDSIFRRVSLPYNILNKLKELTKNRLFNSHFFNKWEFWSMASKNDTIKNNIPFTRLYKSFEDMDEMFACYDSLFLKPVNGTLGNGLVKVIKTEGGYSFQGKYDHEPIFFTSREQAVDYAKLITSCRHYLVQQCIHLLKNKDQLVDFRVNMQKDYTMKWNCTGIIVCTGANGGIHSNYTNQGGYLVFEDFMMKNLSISKAETDKKKHEIVRLCKKTCEMLDDSGENYGDLGIDIGFDQHLKPWVFEANKSQFHYLPLEVNDYQTYYAAKTNPLKYAAALSGFMPE